MKPDVVGVALKEMADRWETPVFDPDTLAQHSRLRTRRTRHRVLAAAAVVVVAASGAIAVAALTSSSGDSNSTLPDSSMRPAELPPVRITAINTTGRRIDGVPVLARVPRGVAVIVPAELSFFGRRPAAVNHACLIIGKPGTYGGVSGTEVDSYYRDRHLEIARGSFVTATSPEPSTLSVTAPKDLSPGRYPVFSAYHSVLLPGQEPGIEGPFDVSGQIGVLIITGN